MNGERALWCAVIEQAITDAFYRPMPKTILRSSPVRRPKWVHDRQRAREWLTGDSKDFRDICSMADVDPDAMLQQMRGHAARDWIVDDHIKKRLTKFEQRT